jgi:periplasmic protein CpxP/Spy
MKRLRGSLVIAVIASTVLWGATAFAQGPGQGWHGHGKGDAVLRSVGLTDAQKAQIQQIRASHRAEMRTLYQQLGAARRQMATNLYSATPPTTADVDALNQLSNQLAQKRLQIALEVRNVLTPEQLAKAAQTTQQMRQLRDQMRSLTNPS